jgi:transcriptional regulator with XRE-family HTH domain
MRSGGAVNLPGAKMKLHRRDYGLTDQRAQAKCLGLAIEFLRGDRTQAQLAQLCGLTPSMWSLYETGTSWPRRRNLGRVASALGTTCQGLLTAAKKIRSGQLLARSPDEPDRWPVSPEDFLAQHPSQPTTEPEITLRREALLHSIDQDLLELVSLCAPSTESQSRLVKAAMELVRATVGMVEAPSPGRVPRQKGQAR